MDYMAIAINFMGGLGLFIFGMNTMASGLQKSAGSKMKKLLEALTRSKLMGVIVGCAVTAVIQSSSATTVMVVGFVNAGIMNLTQAVGIIMGANIGTTATAWIVSSVEWAKFLSPDQCAPVFIFIGAFMMMFAKRDRFKQIGEFITGFGILFVGMTLMSDAANPLKDSPVISQLFITLGKNPLLGLLAGTVVTGIIQSSSASVSILQALAMSGLVPWNTAVYIIMGQNIGTCATALLSSIGTNKNAQAAANVHLLFNIIGSLVFTVVGVIYFTLINRVAGEVLISSTEISLVHTVFNIANVVLLYGFSDQLVKMAQKMTDMLSKPGAEDDEEQPVHLDDRILTASPAFAIESCLKEIQRLGRMALKNLKLANEALIEMSEEKIDEVLSREKRIDNLQEAINQYMVKLVNSDISEEQNKKMTSLFHTVIDIERIGDHSENVAELARYRMNDGLVFSDTAVEELKNIMNMTEECVSDSVNALSEDSMEYVYRVINNESDIDDLETYLRERHINRLTKGECQTAPGIIFLDVITNLERISDHALNIAE
ncbi:MAG: Na/Pi cotransporter family protein, partial [Clostridiales bacterium]|nr:Na/Pi cotransporter family protein [Clostridiales bacterium]